MPRPVFLKIFGWMEFEWSWWQMLEDERDPGRLY